MQLSIGNAPCSWGVEFADDPRNPPWTRVLDEAQAAGYTGIELGPLGYMPEDPAVLGPALAERNLTLIGGVLARAIANPELTAPVREFAALQFLQLVVVVPQRRALGFAQPMTPAELEDWADSSVRLFLDGCRGWRRSP